MPTCAPFPSNGVPMAVLTIIMPDTNNKRPAPFSLRLTPEERRQLEDKAAGMPLGGYIRACLFQKRGKLPVRDNKALAHILSKLGQSRLASNVNQLAKAVNTGSLPVTPETENALQAACRDIRAIKQMLMKALGIQER